MSYSFVGPKNKTSRGWVRCVEFTGRQTNQIAEGHVCLYVKPDDI